MMNTIHKMISLTAVLLVCFTAGSLEAKDRAPKGAGQKIFKSTWAKSLKSGNKKRYFPDVASPVFANGRVYVGTHSGLLYAFDAASGDMIWATPTNGPIAAKPLADNDLIIVGNNKGFVSAVEAATGKPAWQVYVGGEVLAAPVRDGNTVFVPTQSREVYAISRDDGRVLWSQFIKGYDTKFTMRGHTSLLPLGGRLYAGFADGQVVALSPSTGETLWSQNLATGQEPFRDIDATLRSDGSALFAVGYFGYLVKLSPADGHVIWKREARSGADMSLEGDYIVLSTSDGHVAAFDKESGQRQWDIPLHSGALSAPHIQGNTVIVGGREGKLFVLSLSNGQVLQTLPMASGYMGQGSPVQNGFYILSATAKLYAFGAR